MSIDVDEVAGLRSDLQVLADAFQDKEAELASLLAEQGPSRERREALAVELETARESGRAAAATLKSGLEKTGRLQASEGAEGAERGGIATGPRVESESVPLSPRPSAHCGCRPRWSPPPRSAPGCVS
jgi:hypothetical protein